MPLGKRRTSSLLSLSFVVWRSWPKSMCLFVVNTMYVNHFCFSICRNALQVLIAIENTQNRTGLGAHEAPGGRNARY